MIIIKHFKNKKGNTALTIIAGVLAFAVIAGLIAFFTIGTPQTAVTTTTTITPSGEPTTLTPSQTGKIVTFQARAIDLEPSTDVQVAVPVTCWDDGLFPSANNYEGIDAVTLIEKNTTTLSATADTTIDPVSTGQTVKCQAFNTTYISDGASVFVEREGSTPLEIPVHRTTSAVDITLFKDSSDSGSTTANGTLNLTIAANGFDTYDKMRIKNQGTDAVYPLMSIFLDLQTSSNLDDPSILAGVYSGDGSTIDLISNTDMGGVSARKDYEYRWDLAKPLMLHQGETYTTGEVRLKTNGNNPSEDFIFWIVDWGQFLSTQSGTRDQFLVGIEVDSSPARDVGFNDIGINQTAL